MADDEAKRLAKLAMEDDDDDLFVDAEDSGSHRKRKEKIKNI
jgi:hypothetical protein